MPELLLVKPRLLRAADRRSLRRSLRPAVLHVCRSVSRTYHRRAVFHLQVLESFPVHEPPHPVDASSHS
ncbi:hypothetical protein Csa_008566 [Cucumis sativus]|nr:hypothetical protein Csa_008566 [Cucumis sativus]